MNSTVLRLLASASVPIFAVAAVAFTGADVRAQGSTTGTVFVQDVPKPARQAYSKGMERLQRGKSAEGEQLMREAIRFFGDYYDATMGLAAELYRTGRYDEARDALVRAGRINDGGWEPKYYLGLVLWKQGALDQAEGALRDAIARGARGALPHFFLAVVLVDRCGPETSPDARAALLDEAGRELDRTSEANRREIPLVHLQRARVFERQGRMADAAAELEAYLKADPNAPDVPKLRAAAARMRAHEP